MNKTDLRIVFMGTPEFAVSSLQILVENDFNIVGVITAPDKPQGRGRKLIGSAVKQFAVENDLNILQPTNLKDPEFIETLAALKANLQIVVAFRMLPEVVWNMPEIGTFNLHASLLPNYRGAAPINWAIINGESETGVTTFFLEHEIDTGEIIFQEKEPITASDDVGSLYGRLMKKGADLVLRTVEAILNENYTTTKQDYSQDLKNAPKIFRETCEINFNAPANEVLNFIRGLSPYPAAWIMINGEVVKILKAHIVESSSKNLQPGQYVSDDKTYWHIKSKDKIVAVEELQWQGKKKMDITSFLRGNNIPKF